MGPGLHHGARLWGFGVELFKTGVPYFPNSYFFISSELCVFFVRFDWILFRDRTEGTRDHEHPSGEKEGPCPRASGRPQPVSRAAPIGEECVKTNTLRRRVAAADSDSGRLCPMMGQRGHASSTRRLSACRGPYPVRIKLASTIYRICIRQFHERANFEAAADTPRPRPGVLQCSRILWHRVPRRAHMAKIG